MPSDFFSLCAQIIPVLFLAVTLQSSYFSRMKYTDKEDFQRNIHAMLVLFVMLVLIMAEFVALRGIYENNFRSVEVFIIVYLRCPEPCLTILPL